MLVYTSLFYFKLAYYSARIKHDLMKTLKDYRPYMKLSLISYPSIKIGHLSKKSLGQIPFRYTSNIIYKISCACGHSYIWQTCRCLPDRVKELKETLTKPSRFSYVAEHSKDSGHNIDWFKVNMITRDNITIKRLIKETLAISSL